MARVGYELPLFKVMGGSARWIDPQRHCEETIFNQPGKPGKGLSLPFHLGDPGFFWH